MSLIEKKSLLDLVLEAKRFFEIALGKSQNKFGFSKAGNAFTFNPSELGVYKLLKKNEQLFLVVKRDFTPAKNDNLFMMAYNAFKKDCVSKDPANRELLFVPVSAHQNWNGDCESFSIYLNPQPNELALVGDLASFEKDPFRFFIQNCTFKPVIENEARDNSLNRDEINDLLAEFHAKQ